MPQLLIKPNHCFFIVEQPIATICCFEGKIVIPMYIIINIINFFIVIYYSSSPILLLLH